ncbi:MAG TPA: DUF3054 domain-containing protein [Actinomycetota bacterium]|jgi:hypothetical protein|nr:DUF3054 domain-containing protein [Actinomycetota bacterium]
MRPLLDGTKLARAVLIGDVVAILVFLLFGISSHHEDAVSRFLTLALIFVSAWVGTAWAIGTYRPVSNGRLIANLAIAIPIGVLVRVAVVGSLTAGQILTFAIVALVFASIFVGLARVVVMVLFRMNHWEETS